MKEKKTAVNRPVEYTCIFLLSRLRKINSWWKSLRSSQSAMIEWSWIYFFLRSILTWIWLLTMHHYLRHCREKCTIGDNSSYRLRSKFWYSRNLIYSEWKNISFPNVICYMLISNLKKFPTPKFEELCSFKFKYSEVFKKLSIGGLYSKPNFLKF